MPQQFVHGSDFHYRADPANNVEINSVVARWCWSYPNAIRTYTGDVTSNGTSAEYELAVPRLTTTAPAGLIVCPGNHDEEWAGNFYNPFARRRFEKAFNVNSWPQLVIPCAGVVIIALDSVCHTLSPLDFACGKIGSSQRQALDGLLTHYEAWTRVVMLHHHPWDRGFGHYLIDARQFLEVCRNRVDLLLFGHNHVREAYADIQGIRYALAAGKAADADSSWLVNMDGNRITYEGI